MKPSPRWDETTFSAIVVLLGTESNASIADMQSASCLINCNVMGGVSPERLRVTCVPLVIIYYITSGNRHEQLSIFGTLKTYIMNDEELVDEEFIDTM